MTKTQMRLAKTQKRSPIAMEWSPFYCFLQFGCHIKTKQKHRRQTSMECQIILTCDDLEKNSGTNVAVSGFFLLCLYLLFCFGVTNTGFVVNGFFRSSVPCRVTSVLCENLRSLPRSTINLLFLLVKLPIGFAVLCHVLQLSTNT